MKDKIKIQEKLANYGYKIHFWYKDAKLDAIVVAKWEGEDLTFQKEYSPDDIAELVFEAFLNQSNSPEGGK